MKVLALALLLSSPALSQYNAGLLGISDVALNVTIQDPKNTVKLNQVETERVGSLLLRTAGILVNPDSRNDLTLNIIIGSSERIGKNAFVYVVELSLFNFAEYRSRQAIVTLWTDQKMGFGTISTDRPFILVAINNLLKSFIKQWQMDNRGRGAGF